MNGAICGVPASAMVTLRTETEPERWCYGERKRRTGVHTLIAPSFDWLCQTEAWGWAEPHWVYRCDGCGHDRRYMW
jgi:hypothetical protein